MVIAVNITNSVLATVAAKLCFNGMCGIPEIDDRKALPTSERPLGGLVT